MGWLNKKPDDQVEQNLIPAVLVSTLNSLDRESIIVNTSGKVLFATEKIQLLNLINEGKISSEELLALVRVVRRTGQTQEGSIEVARGPIGSGKRELQITAALISPDGLVLVIIDDEGEKQEILLPISLMNLKLQFKHSHLTQMRCLRLKMSQSGWWHLPTRLNYKQQD
jgi:two-component system sensor histidine kinase SenX3